MGFLKSKKAGKPPHTYYPDILHWREGDKIYCWNVAKAIGYSKAKSVDYLKYMKGNNSMDNIYARASFTFKSVDENGMVYVEDEDGILLQFEFYQMIKCSKNESYESRKVQANFKESNNYMELMKAFQKSYDELQHQDTHQTSGQISIDEPTTNDSGNIETKSRVKS
ncbi:hypothetical protein [Balneola vulgaris]|uniref:hypothetical protein n=1 Tax=Balneola vulgaris TaxID=287535 RepID=UPI0003722A09|nr:hypothetical protein [Balneola vulgaris]